MGAIYSGLIISGINEEAINYDVNIFTVDLCVLSRQLTISPRIDKLKSLVRKTLSFIDFSVAGIIYVSQYSRDITGLLDGITIPSVMTFCSTKESDYTVNYDDHQGAYIAVDYLAKHNHKKIAMISGPIDSISMNYRTIGYQRALIDNNFVFNPSLIRIGDWSLESGYRVMNELIHSFTPDAVFSQNDAMAIGSIRAIEAHGMKIPQDISIIGFDNNFTSMFSTPALSSVDPKFKNLGHYSMQMLMNAIRKMPVGNSKAYLPCEIVHRKTTLG